MFSIIDYSNKYLFITTRLLDIFLFYPRISPSTEDNSELPVDRDRQLKTDHPTVTDDRSTSNNHRSLLPLSPFLFAFVYYVYEHCGPRKKSNHKQVKQRCTNVFVPCPRQGTCSSHVHLP